MGNLVKAASWGILGQFAKLIIKFGANLLLATLLSPKEFGQVGMVTILVTLLSALSELGLFTSIVQKKDINQSELSSVFWINFFLGLGVSILFFFSAEIVSDFYSEPDLILIIRILSLNFLLNSLTITHNALLTRSLSFVKLEIYTTSSTLIASLVAIVLAYNGFGVWALVGLYFLTSLFNVLFVWGFEKWRPSFVFQIKSIKNLLSFGLKISLSSILNNFFAGLDTVVIGKYFAATTLGMYSFSQNLINIPTITISGVFSRVLLPVMSNAQDDVEIIKQTYKRAIGLVNFFFIPVMLSISFYSLEIVTFFFDEKWIPMAPYFRLSSILSIFYPISVLNINILLAKGKGGDYLRLEIAKKILVASAIFAGISFGVIGILYALIIASSIGLLLNMYISSRFSNYSVSDQLRDIFPIAFISLLHLLILWVFDTFVFGTHVAMIVNVFLSMLIASGIYFLVAKKIIPETVADFYGVLSRFVPQKK